MLREVWSKMAIYVRTKIDHLCLTLSPPQSDLRFFGPNLSACGLDILFGQNCPHGRSYIKFVEIYSSVWKLHHPGQVQEHFESLRVYGGHWQKATWRRYFSLRRMLILGKAPTWTWYQYIEYWRSWPRVQRESWEPGAGSLFFWATCQSL